MKLLAAAAATATAAALSSSTTGAAAQGLSLPDGNRDQLLEVLNYADVYRCSSNVIRRTLRRKRRGKGHGKLRRRRHHHHRHDHGGDDGDDDSDKQLAEADGAMPLKDVMKSLEEGADSDSDGSVSDSDSDSDSGEDSDSDSGEDSDSDSGEDSDSDSDVDDEEETAVLSALWSPARNETTAPKRRTRRSRKFCRKVDEMVNGLYGCQDLATYPNVTSALDESLVAAAELYSTDCAMYMDDFTQVEECASCLRDVRTLMSEEFLRSWSIMDMAPRNIPTHTAQVCSLRDTVIESVTECTLSGACTNDDVLDRVVLKDKLQGTLDLAVRAAIRAHEAGLDRTCELEPILALAEEHGVSLVREASLKEYEKRAKEAMDDDNDDDNKNGSGLIVGIVLGSTALGMGAFLAWKKGGGGDTEASADGAARPDSQSSTQKYADAPPAKTRREMSRSSSGSGALSPTHSVVSQASSGDLYPVAVDEAE